MSTEVAVYIGIGQYNKGEVTASSTEDSMKHLVGKVYGPNGLEKLKLCDSILELGDLPDINELIKERHAMLVAQEVARHEENMANLQRIKAA